MNLLGHFLSDLTCSAVATAPARWFGGAALAALVLSGAAAAIAAEHRLSLSRAWVPNTLEVGRDIPLHVTIRNDADSPDALVRAKCPIANFSEKHTVDRGEGAPAMRAISAIPVPSGGEVSLSPTGYHVMLLQTREPLEIGRKFICTLVFQKAGSIETEVEVRQFP